MTSYCLPHIWWAGGTSHIPPDNGIAREGGIVAFSWLALEKSKPGFVHGWLRSCSVTFLAGIGALKVRSHQLGLALNVLQGETLVIYIPDGELLCVGISVG